MKVSEDRFPLLFVHFEDEEDRYDVRARTIGRGAAEIISRWPQYLTFVSYMSVIGLLSLLVCFVLSVLVLLLTTSGGPRHVPKRFFAGKCDSKEENYQMTDLWGLSDAENSTFIVDIASDGRNRSVKACAVESYLTWTTRPVYHIHVVKSSASPGDSRMFKRFENKYKNYRSVIAREDSLLTGTPLGEARRRTPNALRYLVAVLVSWNFAGTVIDADLLTVANPGSVVNRTNGSLVVGLSGGVNSLISSRRVCHSFVFDLMRYLSKGGNGTNEEAVLSVRRDFCSNGRNCSSVEILSTPFFCDLDSMTEECIFATTKEDSPSGADDVWNRICPMVKFFAQS